MPALLEKRHAKKLHLLSFGLLILLIVILVSIPLADEKKVKEQYSKPFIRTEQPATPPPELNPKIEEGVSAAPEQQLPLPQTPPAQNAVTIKTTWGMFSPNETQIPKGTRVTWLHADSSKMFLIACYIGPNRVLKSENFFPGQSFSYTFTEEDEYLCIDAIYGARGIITVGEKKRGNSITGSVVNINNLQGSPRISFSLDPVRRILLDKASFSAILTLAVILFIISTLEYTIRLD